MQWQLLPAIAHKSSRKNEAFCHLHGYLLWRLWMGAGWGGRRETNVWDLVDSHMLPWPALVGFCLFYSWREYDPGMIFFVLAQTFLKPTIYNNAKSGFIFERILQNSTNLYLYSDMIESLHHIMASSGAIGLIERSSLQPNSYLFNLWPRPGIVFNCTPYNDRFST